MKQFHCLLAFAALLLFLPCGHANAQLPPGAKALRDQSYVTNGHPRQKLDLFLPESPKGPLLVWIHGGGWIAGTKSDARGLDMLKLGYAVASLEYRFSTDAIFPAQIEDCKAAIRWLRAHAPEYGYDPKRIAVWGESAGGHLTALLATSGSNREFDVGENLDQCSAIQCGIDLYGPADFPGWKPASNDPTVSRKDPASLLVKLLGGPVDDKPELARRGSPVTWVTRDSAPLMILHGTADPIVGLDQSQSLTEKYKSAGAEATLDIVQAGGHGGPGFADAERIKRMIEFLDRHLGSK